MLIQQDAFLCPDCDCTTHIPCLASHFLGESERVVPTHGQCPRCDASLEWGQVIRARYAVMGSSQPSTVPVVP